jgi:ATP-dependent DNA ligase
LPSGSAWSLEVKWDGFRAIVSTANGLCVRSRRGWNLTDVVDGRPLFARSRASSGLRGLR